MRLFISTPYEIERGSDRGCERKEGCRRKKEKESPLYCRIGILPRIRRRALFRLFLSSLHATRGREVQLHVYWAYTVSSLHAANFARFHATVSHDTVVVNFQLTDDSRAYRDIDANLPLFLVVPHRLDVVENHNIVPFVAFIYARFNRKLFY